MKNAFFWDVAPYRRSTRRHIPQDGTHHSHRRENLKSYKLFPILLLWKFGGKVHVYRFPYQIIDTV
jgi:hypothetical protein